jgi:hypothetical protein
VTNATGTLHLPSLYESASRAAWRRLHEAVGNSQAVNDLTGLAADPAFHSRPQAMTRVAVTGGSGKLGRAVIAELVESGYDVFNFDIAPPRTAQPVPFTGIDLTDYGQTVEALGGIDELHDGLDAVIHLAATWRNAWSKSSPATPRATRLALEYDNVGMTHSSSPTLTPSCHAPPLTCSLRSFPMSRYAAT